MKTVSLRRTIPWFLKSLNISEPLEDESVFYYICAFLPGIFYFLLLLLNVIQQEGNKELIQIHK